MSNVSGMPQGGFDAETQAAFFEFRDRPQDFMVHAAFETGLGDQFPPEPAQLTAMTIAYRNDENIIRKRFAMLGETGVGFDWRAEGDVFKAAFRQQIGPMRAVKEQLETLEGGMDLGKLILGAVEKSREAGLRTIAGFVLFAAEANPNKRYAGLYIPRKTFTDIPLEFRELLLSTLSHAKQEGTDLQTDGSPELAELIQDVLRNEPWLANVAFLAASLHLDEHEALEAEVDKSINEQFATQQTRTTAGMDRKTRRQLAHQERRAARKKDLHN